MQKSIRIKPEFTVESHSIRLSSGQERTFERRKWYETSDAELIKACEETRIQFENPKSPLLFDVLSPEEAAALHRAENEAVEPSATPDDPISLDGRRRPKKPAGGPDAKAVEQAIGQFRAEIESAGRGLERFVGEAKAALDEAKAIAAQAKTDLEAARTSAAESKAALDEAKAIAAQLLGPTEPAPTPPPAEGEKAGDESKPQGGKKKS
jgi:hypothetical protein